MSKFEVEFNGQKYLVSERQFLFIQRLKNAMASVLAGQTVAGGVVEISEQRKMRGFYFVQSDDEYDLLLERWHDFRKVVEQDAVYSQGNAPESNRSIARN